MTVKNLKLGRTFRSNISFWNLNLTLKSLGPPYSIKKALGQIKLKTRLNAAV